MQLWKICRNLQETRRPTHHSQSNHEKTEKFVPYIIEDQKEICMEGELRRNEYPEKAFERIPKRRIQEAETHQLRWEWYKIGTSEKIRKEWGLFSLQPK